jgi:hypothetical protein
MMVMDRAEMKKAGAPHNQGITWSKFATHRSRCVPGYVPKCPTVGAVVPDGKINSVVGLCTLNQVDP